MSEILLEACPICEGTQIKHTFITSENSISQCKDCNFMFLNPQPTDEVLASIYSNGYFLDGRSSKSANDIHEMKQNTAKLYLEELFPFCNGNGMKLLDVGCGNGDFLVAAQDYGFEVDGIEINEQAARIANTKLKKECVRRGNLETIALPADYYNVCVLFDVLEHTRNPILILRKIYNTLKTDGVLFMVIPSLSNLSYKLLRSNWMEFKKEHLQYFNNTTIQYALQKTDFSKITIKPNIKNLTFSYINSHFQRFKVPIFTNLISFCIKFLPNFIKHHKFNINTSGIRVLCRKTINI